MVTTDEAIALVERFGRMVAGDGASLTLLAVEGETVRVGYRPGGAGSECPDGSCVLPHSELEQLMTEVASRRIPGARVRVELSG